MSTAEQVEESPRDVSFWLEELADARKREKGYRKLAKEAISFYEAEDSEHRPFNILYSNTETLKAALYNSTPRPVVQQRFKAEDKLGTIAAQIATRYLEFFIDSNDRDYSSFDELLSTAVQEALVSGRGLTEFKYEVEFEGVPATVAGKPASKRVSHEAICGEEIPWDRVFFGYAKRWAEVPWVAFELFMTEDQLKKNFGEAAKGIPLAVTAEAESNSKSDKNTRPDDMAGAELAHIYKIWDKESRQVIFICPDTSDRVIKAVEDPLKLDGFFPIPQPLMFGQKLSSMLPIPLYAWYKKQSDELNRITIRIENITKALKVRGFYDSSIEGIAKVLTAEDNKLIPAENVAALYDKGGLEKALFLLPIEKLVSVLQQLYVQREAIKQIIYEITAIADVMRGDTKASETLGAQQLKSQWGGQRLRRFQREVQRYVRDCLRIVAEIAFKQLSAETLAALTGIQLPTMLEKQQAQMVAQQAQAAGQQLPPTLAQTLSLPSWDDILAVMKNDLRRNYKIDIETNSTIELEATEDKQNIGEFLNAMAQFLNGIAPLVDSGQLPFEAMKEMLLAVVRRFRFGTDVEDQLKKMQAPQPKTDPTQQNAAIKMQMEQKQAEVDLQIKQQEAAITTQIKQMETQARAQELQTEAALRQAEFAFKMQEFKRKDQLAQVQLASKLQRVQMQNLSTQSTTAGAEGSGNAAL